MKILVPVKRVIDHSVNIRVKKDGSGIESANVKMSINPFDEIALEEALQIKERSEAQEVIALSVGTEKCTETLRTALAMGADRAILVQTEQALLPLNIARVIKHFVEEEGCELVMMGKQSIDGDNNQTAQMLAALTDRAHALFASKVERIEGGWRVARETDDGMEVLQLSGAAVISTDLRLNQPRYIKLPHIMQAKKKPLATVDFDSLNIPVPHHIELKHHEPIAQRQGGEMVSDVAELLDKLRNTEGLKL